MSTLKERFIKYTWQICEDYENDYKQAKECEKIADDYAIEFANWLLTEPFDVSFEGKNIKGLLKEFKKERGL
jgi:hypothetical protein